jgi:hypothetical protein
MPPNSAVQDDEKKERQTRAGRGHHGPLERVTVNLTARASHALDRAAALTGDSKTDTINRALQIYAYLEEITENGGTIYVRESPDGELQIIKMF